MSRLRPVSERPSSGEAVLVLERGTALFCRGYWFVEDRWAVEGVLTRDTGIAGWIPMPTVSEDGGEVSLGPQT